MKQTNKGTKSKKKCQAMHAMKRARERFGINLNMESLVKEIQSQKLTFIERQSLRITLWRRIADDLDIVLVYDNRTKQVATLYPYSWHLENGGVDVTPKSKEDTTKNQREESEIDSVQKIWDSYCFQFENTCF